MPEGGGGIGGYEYGEAVVGKATDVKNYAQGNEGVHGLWERDMACIFDIGMEDLDAPK